MGILLHDFIFVTSVLIISLLFVAAAYVRYTYGYWKRRKVPYLEPTFPYGNNDFFMPKGVSIGTLSKKFYNEFKSLGHKIGGVYIGIEPNLIIVDPECIKDVLIRNFKNFTDRGVYMNENDALSVNIFTQPGPQWKVARAKFTSIFTSSKMKMMFETMLDCSSGLKQALEDMVKQNSDVDALDMVSRYNTDAVGSCAFGIICNSFKYPDAEFCKMCHKFFHEYNLMEKINLFLIICAPSLALKLGVKSIQNEVSKFFLKSISDTVGYREKNNLRRNDLLQLLIDMMSSEVRLTMKELVGQVFLFFAAGFETSSATTTLALFEISKNEHVQDKIREEVQKVLKKYDGKITYEGITEMKYLGQAVDETLRLWTPVATLKRVCTKNHRFENPDITIEKGTPVLIPALGIHHDPDYWPDPMRWDPDRFNEEDDGNRRPLTYLPFGDGPRNCIGLRFGLLQTKIALITMISDYRISLSPKTIVPLDRDPRSFLLVTKNKVHLCLEKL